MEVYGKAFIGLGPRHACIIDEWTMLLHMLIWASIVLMQLNLRFWCLLHTQTAMTQARLQKHRLLWTLTVRLLCYMTYHIYGSFVFLCLVLLRLSCLFIVALWSPAGKGLTFWLLLAMFIVLLLLSHVVSRVRCGTRFYRFLISAVFFTFQL